MAVGLGGFIGANVRYWLSVTVSQSPFPWATFVVNAAGCFGLALVLTLVDHRITLDEQTRLLISTGFFGALTTFSTFSYESLQLFNRGETLLAFLYLAGSLGLGLALGAAGIALGRII